MLIQSNLSQDEYLNALKKNMGRFFALGSERFTGFTIGCWFYVTHHAGYEHFRRITNQKNAALGYVEETPEGCQVKFVRFKGLLCPAQFLLNCVFMLFIAALFLILNHNFATDIASIISIILAGVIVIGAPLEAFQESLTERSEISKKCLMALLYDPVGLSGYQYYKNKL